MSQVIALFGGTFDPIHLGHTGIAQAVSELDCIERVEFIPCHIPAHRDSPNATSAERLAMLKLAINDNPAFSINPYEIGHEKPSITIDTVTHMRETYPDQHFAWVMGNDSWQHFTDWDDWQQILDQIHLIVVNRPGYTLAHPDLLAQHVVHDSEALSEFDAKKIFVMDDIHLPHSATAIRNKHDVPFEALDPAVRQYIKQHNLY
jgi:nicotinate-nucleotide adenylyltransferase